MNTEHAHWKFDSRIASLHCGALAGRVDVSRPQLGVHELRVNNALMDGYLLSAESAHETSVETPQSSEGARWPMKVADAYVRGGDLAASYATSPDSHYSPQIYWQLEEKHMPAVCGVSLVVSVQTDLLDSHPGIRVCTRLAADEVIHVDVPDAACVLWRLAGDRLSYAEVVLASDYRQPPIVEAIDGLYCCRWDLFAEFLEKGVIRRAQIRSVFLPGQDDRAMAAAYARILRNRPLPLTT